MLAYAKASHHALYAGFQFCNHLVIQVIPVVVRNHQVVNIRYVGGLVNVRSLEHFVHETHR